MAKIIGVILLFFSLQSCAVSPRYSPKQKGIDPEFKPYIQEYRNIIGKNKHKDRFERLHMNFVNLDSGILGRCFWLLNGEYEIEMDREWWYSYASFYDKQFVAYHELEHCIRYRLHSNRKEEIENIADFWEEVLFQIGIIDKPGYLKDGCPASIMHSHNTSDWCHIKHYTYYIKEIRNWDSK